MTQTVKYYAEDLAVGTRYLLDAYPVTEEEIVEFATRWDPQGFHVDPAAARGSHFGRLIASGLHTMGINQQLTVRAVYRHWQVIAGRRIRDIEFLRPVVGGMTLTGTVVLEEIRREEARSLVLTRGRLTSDGNAVLESAVETYVHNRPQ